MSQPKLHGGFNGARVDWYQGQLTGGSEEGNGIFHSGSWERLHDKLVLLPNFGG